jgi:hypothetical protein
VTGLGDEIIIAAFLKIARDMLGETASGGGDLGVAVDLHVELDHRVHCPGS